MKSYLFLFIFFLFFSALWSGYEYSMFVSVLCSVFLGLLYVGGLEFLHQCVHGNAVSSRFFNKVCGRFYASLMFMNFDAYRAFHIDHHKYVCKAKDPERALYGASNSSPVMSFFLAPIGHLHFARAVNSYGAKVGNRRRDWVISEVCRFFVLFLLLVLFVYKPFVVLVAHVVPIAVYSWVDYLFNQAEHYGCEVESDQGVCRAPQKVSNDVIVPDFIGCLFLFRNYHRVHHVYPATKWYDAPKVYARIHCDGDERVIRFFDLLKIYLSSGVRRWS
jgi:fatty acid desaturase